MAPPGLSLYARNNSRSSETGMVPSREHKKAPSGAPLYMQDDCLVVERGDAEAGAGPDGTLVGGSAPAVNSVAAFDPA